MNARKICEIRILPNYNATYFEVEYVYEVITEELDLDTEHALSIDLGLNNFATCIDTYGASFILDGKSIKSFNHWYNKENARLQRIKDKQGIVSLTKRQVHLLKNGIIE